MAVLNSSINFVVYVLTSHRFRRDLRVPTIFQFYFQLEFSFSSISGRAESVLLANARRFRRGLMSSLGCENAAERPPTELYPETACGGEGTGA